MLISELSPLTSACLQVEKASTAVQTVADDAQADIGLDYAWLDDVTYLDWRRYHALLDSKFLGST